jgi:hypothetical protein
VASQQLRESAGKMNEVRPALRVQRVFQTLGKRSFLIVLEKHLPEPFVLASGFFHQYGKEGAFFLGLVMFVFKQFQEAHNGFDVFGVD